MNQYNYLKEQKRGMLFVRQYHADNNYKFWPDQARAHYAKSVINYLNENNVTFVRKNDNPVNVAQKKTFILKQQVYKNNCRAKKVKQLYQSMQYYRNKLDMNLVQRFFSSVK